MDFLSEINAKYSELEEEADKMLEKARREEEKLQKQESKWSADNFASLHQAPKQLSYNEARARNANLLKSIDMAKARLRSRSAFSPVEQILEKAIENYKRDILSALTPQQTQQVQLTERHNRGHEETDDEENIYETVQ